MKTNKRGISLIVLVITIIVMIILAAAIILALDGAGIIGKANQAVDASNLANAKTVVALADAEWQLMSEAEQTAAGSFSAYARAKLENAGFDMTKLYIDENGNLLTGTTAGFLANNVPLGATVTGYTLDPTATTYPTSGKETLDYDDGFVEPTYVSQDVNRNENITWTYVGLNEHEEVVLAGSVGVSQMRLNGSGAFLYGPDELDDACAALYSSDMGQARNMNIEDVERILEYTGERGGYFDTTSTYVPTNQAKLISDLETEFGALGSRVSPNRLKNIEAYYSDYYMLSVTGDEDEYNTTLKDLIFPTSVSGSYWLSSSWARAGFDRSFVEFGVSKITQYGLNCYDANTAGGYYSWASYQQPFEETGYLRPVVVLSSDLDVTYSGGVVTLN